MGAAGVLWDEAVFPTRPSRDTVDLGQAPRTRGQAKGHFGSLASPEGGLWQAPLAECGLQGRRARWDSAQAAVWSGQG